MSAPDPEILSMEEVREIAASTRCQPGVWNWQEHARLCVTVEHYAGKLVEGTKLTWYCPKCDRWQDRRTGCEADIRFDERQKAEGEAAQIAAEQDRLRALVAGMREALRCSHEGRRCTCAFVEGVRWGACCPSCAEKATVRQLLADPDGQLAYELAAKDREDAGRWREMAATTDQMLKEWDETDPMTRLAEEAAEESEELRLLRDVEAARLCYEEALCHEGKFGLGECAHRRGLMELAWKSLAAFRARQKGDPR